MWAFLTMIICVPVIAITVYECLESYWKYRKYKDGLK